MTRDELIILRNDIKIEILGLTAERMAGFHRNRFSYYDCLKLILRLLSEIEELSKDEKNE